MWREVGHQMHIEGIPDTYEEMRDWADAYEKRAMLPSEVNHQLAETTTALLLYYTPSIVKGFAKKILVGLMDDNLRGAMMYPVQPAYVYNTLNGFFAVRRFLTRNFFLPRWKPVKYVQEKPNEFGKYNVNFTDNEVLCMGVLTIAMVHERRICWDTTACHE
jgi:hypothetical protein